VLFLFPYDCLGGGGAQRVFSIVLKHLDRELFDLHLGLLRPRRGPEDEIPGDVTVHDLGVKRTRYTVFGIGALVRKLKPDTVISTLGHMNISLLLAKRLGLLPADTRVLVRESTTPSVFLKKGTGYPRTWTALYRWLYPQADAIICLSDAMKNDLAQKFSVPLHKLVKIYNPIDAVRIQDLARSGGTPFQSAGPNLVAAGRFYREKGFDLILEALPYVLASYPGAQLTLLGDGPCETSLRAQAEALGVQHVVSFPGMQHNPWRYFFHADLVVVPSRYDGLPNVPLEALALGVPVVATDCPGAIREIEGSPAIRLVAPEDPGALANGILSALSDSGKRTASSIAKFNLEHAVRQYTDVLSHE
jgi:glycosyltransferase involved in cell wall biosynthesis